MPELPEVESIRRSLKLLEGRTIRDVILSPLAPVETTRPAAIRRSLADSTLTALERHGKYLLLRNQAGSALVLHLGMSGRLRFFEAEPPHYPKHTHLRLHFSDASVLVFEDARRFGTLSLSQKPGGGDNAFLSRLGPDYLEGPLSDEEFIARCRRHNGLNLKALALHQGIGAGLGNIYACEALYRAALDPRRGVGRTSDVKLAELLKAARETLRLGIRHGGSSLRDYFDGLGNRGVMKDFLQVYGREGQSTLDGRGMVRRIVQQSRSTWFCPQVQR
ncbi:MAG TPA: DNA-formamidopyrimidine glycosylase [Deltaproteobacteria bacterium]|nr:DNA-formamidopyrimidine glycosylase [Deltaproteobacteria bacterium]